ncbi:MAG: hypothetical protein J5780_03025 [Treponema sp.]|nr:hypothetical protein [Treponema sp.]
MKRIAFNLILACLVFMLASCGASLSVKAGNDRSAKVQFGMELGKVFASTFEDIAQNTGANDFDLFSEKEISSAFNGSDFKDVKVSVPSKTSLSVSGTVPPSEKQKAVSNEGSLKIANFVLCTDSSLTLIISPESVKGLSAQFPQESREFLDLFMAPVLTDEKMSIPEYLDLVASVYGDDIAGEIKNASISVSLECPSGKNIKKTSLSNAASSKTGSSKTTFAIPLADFLCLDLTRVFSISW